MVFVRVDDTSIFVALACPMNHSDQFVNQCHAASALVDTSCIDPFKDWATNLVSGGDLTQKSADKYGTLWKAWRGWLMALGHDWPSATATVIEQFLQGPAPGQGGRRPALHSSRMSGYTRQRYWRLLRGVYAHAVHMGCLSSSPVLDVPERARPVVSMKDRQSQVLEPGILALLRDPVMLTQIVVVKTAFDWWHVRDRAMLALLVDTGITTDELACLRGMDLKFSNWQGLGDTSAQGDTHRGSGAIAANVASLLLEVADSTDGVGRVLPVSAKYLPLLQAWLTQRQVLLQERAARTAMAADRHALVCELDQRGPLFVARRARSADSVLPIMKAVTIYYTVANALKKFRRLYQLEIGAVEAAGQADPYVAKGAAVIRNSVIAHWLQTLGVMETLRLAGLKNVASLRLPLPVGPVPVATES